MDFTAVTEGPDPVTVMNFRSGRAYAHTCTPCGRAVLLWQCCPPPPAPPPHLAPQTVLLNHW
ncbi:hypothetical protein ACIP46_17075 [Streptomyces lavendulae]|uniref:hypothetical protein n=1 Tax=Streptomyces lavendulae TaxID=1914 RepID=UPI0037FA0FA0